MSVSRLETDPSGLSYVGNRFAHFDLGDDILKLRPHDRYAISTAGGNTLAIVAATDPPETQ